MVATECKEWVLTDWFGDPEGDPVYPKVVVQSAEQLRQILAEYAEQEPRLLNLDRAADIRLGIALGGPYGVVEVYSLGGKDKSLIALAPVETAKEDVIFVGDWQPSPFTPKYLLPAKDVIELVLCLYQQQRLPECVRWEG